MEKTVKKPPGREPLAVALASIVVLEAEVVALRRSLGIVMFCLAGQHPEMTARLLGMFEDAGKEARAQQRRTEFAETYDELAEMLRGVQQMMSGAATLPTTSEAHRPGKV